MWGTLEKRQQNWIVCGLVSVLSFAAAGCTGTAVPLEEIRESAATAAASEANSANDQSNGTEENGGTAVNTPDVNLTASNLSVPEGGSVTLSWNATGADSCSASGGWSGQLAASGSQLVGPVTAGTTFSLNCNGPGGTSLEMISVAVVGPVDLSWVAPDQNADGSELVDLAGYKLYYGENSREYSEVVELADASATSHTLDLPTGSYYFAMTAFDTEGHESSYSNEVQRYRP